MQVRFLRFIAVVAFAFAAPTILLHPFAGKIKPPKEIIRVYAEDRTNRTISFLALANLTPGTNDYLARDILKNIALVLQGTKTIRVTEGDLALSVKNQDYEAFVFTNRFERIDFKDTNLHLSDLRTNKNFAYSFTNSGRYDPLSVTAFQFRSNRIYIDPMLSTTTQGFSSSNLKPGEWVLTNRQHPGLPDLMIVSESNHYIRRFEVENKLLEAKNISIGELFRESRSDYLVGGEIKSLADNQLSLSLVLFDRKRGSAKSFFKKTIIPERWYEETATVPRLILAEIQGREMVSNLLFTSTPPGAFLYLNGQYIGTTPFTLIAWPTGDYPARFWHPQGFFDAAATRDFIKTNVSTNGVPKTLWVFSNRGGKEELSHAHMNAEVSGSSHHAIFARDNRAGKFKLSLTGVPADIYLNSALIAVRTNQVEETLETGNYYLEVRVPKAGTTNAGSHSNADLLKPSLISNLGVSNATLTSPMTQGSIGTNPARKILNEPVYTQKMIRLTIHHQGLTEISLRLRPDPPPSPLGKFLFDHGRNTKLFLILTIGLSAAGSYALYRSLNYNDRLQVAASQGSGTQTFYREQVVFWNTWALGLGGAAGGAGLLTLISRILDVTGSEVRIETDYNHSPDLRFRYIYSKTF